jgi:hypothetical protein
MPIDLTDDELATAANACRAMAHPECQRAKAVENPTLRPMEDTSQRCARLAVKFEAVLIWLPFR